MTRILVITTLDSEFEAFVTLCKRRNEELVSFSINDTIQGWKIERDDLLLVIVKNPVFGRVQASLTASSAIESINPNYVLLVGVAGGMANRGIEFGDILIASQIVDFSNEKIVDSQSTFKTVSYKASEQLFSKAKSLTLVNWFLEFKKLKQFRNVKYPKVHFGTIASSDRVITSQDQMDNLLKTNRDLIGVEMEGSGIAAAIEHSTKKPQFIMIRSVSDKLAGKENNVLVASYIAACFAIKLIYEKIIENKKPSTSEPDPFSAMEDIVYNNEFELGEGAILDREMDISKASLNSKSYARVLSEVLRTSKGEICFALFGHWGRGKTYLMHLTANELNDEYDTYWFSAWKYRTKPELWVYLYESITQQVDKFGFFKRVPLIFRGQFLQFGIWPIVFLLVSLSLVLIPFGAVFLYILGILGVLGFIKATNIYRFGKGQLPNLKKFVALNRHSDKLGLQGLLGKELKFLLLGIYEKIKASRIAVFGSILVYTTSILILNLCLFWGLNRSSHFVDIEEIVPFSFYPAQSIVTAIAIGLDIFLVATPFWLFLTTNKKKRSLLIIDDLDRVTPDEMLEIIESLKLFLEDEKIQKVLQIVMIVEENALKYAIKNKYYSLIGNQADAKFESNLAEKVYHENVQKLFVAFLKLPQLTLAEGIEYSSLFLDYLAPSVDATSKEESDSHNTSQSSQTSNAAMQPQNSFEIPEFEPSVERETKVEELTNDEKEAINASLSVLLDASNKWVSIGPRAIKSFIFRYKLGRRLIEARGHVAINPKLFATLIAQSISGVEIDLRKLKDLGIDELVVKAVLDEIC